MVLSFPSSSAVYTIVINDKLYRRTLQNAYASISSIEQEIRRIFKIEYDFDLTYKGAILPSNSSFIDQRIDSAQPLRIRPKSHLIEDECSISTQPILVSEIPRIDLTDTSVGDKIRTESHNTVVMYNAWTDQHWRSVSPINDTKGDGNRQSKKLMSKIYADNHILQIANPTATVVEHFSNRTSSIITDDFGRSSIEAMVNAEEVIPYTTSTATLKSEMCHRVDTIQSNHLRDEFQVPLHMGRNSVVQDTVFKDGISSGEQSVIVKVVSLTKVYTMRVHVTATLQNLWQSIDDICKNETAYTETKRIFPLLFNNRMHIFSDIRIENEALESFLQFKSSSIDEQNLHFFIYFLPQTESEYIYAYQKEPREIFAHSHWWIAHAFPAPQDPVAHSMILTSLFALRQYFRQPPKDEAHRRQQLEVKFFILIQQYFFLPAVTALVHALQSKMFAFEKAVLSDALLYLLREFCPEDIEPTILGTFMPNLICWLLEQCVNIDG
ncbi:unnamed protein product [Rotaria sp. Silwood1]|nr:unnamed protein product [Rotaria sp. Silwood1]